MDIRNYKDIIDAICAKCDFQITQLDVISWLRNFNEEDWAKAITVLTHLEYYSTRDVIRSFDDGIAQVLQIKGNDQRIFLSAVGKIR